MLKPPTFDAADPNGYYQQTIERRRAKAHYNAQWEATHVQLEKITPKREARAG